jgi:cysteinyl-tRNA synthetase
MHKLADRARKNDLAAAQDLHQAGKFIGVFGSDLFSGSDLSTIGQAAGALHPMKDQFDALVAARTAARKAKDFKEADRIRDELLAMGVAIKDSKDGTTWEIAR